MACRAAPSLRSLAIPHSLRMAGICAVFVSSFRDAETVDPVSTVPRLRWASVAVPVRVAKNVPVRVAKKKDGGGFLFPSPSPVLVEPVPYLDDEAHEGDGEGDFHGDG